MTDIPAQATQTNEMGSLHLDWCGGPAVVNWWKAVK